MRNMLLLTSMMFCASAFAQNLGIGTTNPNYRLHVSAADSSLLILENSTGLNTNIRSSLFFKSGLYYTGAIKSIGQSTNEARIGFFTYASSNILDLKERISILDNGYVGIGVTYPDHVLSVKYPSPALFKLENSITLNNGVSADQYFKSGIYFTGAIKAIGTSSSTARLGFFTDANALSAGLYERLSIADNGFVGIGTTVPAYILDVNGRIRLKHNLNTAGLWLTNAANTDDVAFIGMHSDNHVGIYGDGGGGWSFLMNTITGNVGIGTTSPFYRLHVLANSTQTAWIENTGTGPVAIGILSRSISSSNGTGIFSEGSEIGVFGEADFLGGSANRYGVRSIGKNGATTNYGMYALGQNGTTAIGIYASGSGGSTNWGGYFNGDIYTNGTYVGSDRKLKSEIQPLTNAVSIIKLLKPSTYKYNTVEYDHMHFPKGVQYGLVADEVMQVLPDVVKKTILPEQFENTHEGRGEKISDEVEFNAVNYTAMIPILIGAIQEQQNQIDLLKEEIVAQRKEIEKLKKN